MGAGAKRVLCQDWPPPGPSARAFEARCRDTAGSSEGRRRARKVELRGGHASRLPPELRPAHGAPSCSVFTLGVHHDDEPSKVAHGCIQPSTSQRSPETASSTRGGGRGRNPPDAVSARRARLSEENQRLRRVNAERRKRRIVDPPLRGGAAAGERGERAGPASPEQFDRFQVRSGSLGPCRRRLGTAGPMAAWRRNSSRARRRLMRRLRRLLWTARARGGRSRDRANRARRSAYATTIRIWTFARGGARPGATAPRRPSGGQDGPHRSGAAARMGAVDGRPAARRARSVRTHPRRHRCSESDRRAIQKPSTASIDSRTNRGPAVAGIGVLDRLRWHHRQPGPARLGSDASAVIRTALGFGTRSRGAREAAPRGDSRRSPATPDGSDALSPLLIPRFVRSRWSGDVPERRRQPAAPRRGPPSLDSQRRRRLNTSLRSTMSVSSNSSDGRSPCVVDAGEALIVLRLQRARHRNARSSGTGSSLTRPHRVPMPCANSQGVRRNRQNVRSRCFLASALRSRPGRPTCGGLQPLTRRPLHSSTVDQQSSWACWADRRLCGSSRGVVPCSRPVHGGRGRRRGQPQACRRSVIGRASTASRARRDRGSGALDDSSATGARKRSPATWQAGLASSRARPPRARERASATADCEGGRRHCRDGQPAADAEAELGRGAAALRALTDAVDIEILSCRTPPSRGTR